MSLPLSYTISPPPTFPHTPFTYPPPTHPSNLSSIHFPEPHIPNQHLSQLTSAISYLQNMVNMLTTNVNNLQTDLRSSRSENKRLLQVISDLEQRSPHNTIPDLLSFPDPTVSLPSTPQQPDTTDSSDITSVYYEPTPPPSANPPPGFPSPPNPIPAPPPNPTPTKIPIPPPQQPTPTPIPPPVNFIYPSSHSVNPSECTFNPQSHYHDPTHRLFHDHDILMREFLRLQERQSLLQERQLKEITETRLKKQPSNSKFPPLTDKNCKKHNFVNGTTK